MGSRTKLGKVNETKRVKLAFRKKTLVPAVILILAIVVYYLMFFEAHLKFALTKSLETAVGAEVNIGKLSLGLLDGSLNIVDIEMTDPSNPENNLVSVGRLDLKVSSSDLLKLKLIVENATVENLGFSSKRNSPGWVLPPDPQEPQNDVAIKDSSDGEKLTSEIKTKALDGISKILSGFDPTESVAKIDFSQMPSILKANGLKSTIADKGREFSELMDSLPSTTNLETGMKTLSDIGKVKDIKKLQSDLKVVETSKKDAEAYLKALTNAGKIFSSGIGSLQKSVDGLDADIAGDYQQVLSKLSLPDLEFEGLAKELLGPQVEEYAKLAKKYYDLIAPYIAAPSNKAAVSSKPFRLKGSRVNFASETLPTFWLKKGAINTLKETPSFKDELKGQLTNLSSSIDMTGQPAQLDVSGDLGSLGLYGLAFNSTTKLEQEVFVQTISGSLGRTKVQNKEISKSDSLFLEVKDAEGSGEFNAKIVGSKILVDVRGALDQVVYEIASPDQKIVDALAPVIRDVKKLTVAVKAEGPIESVVWSIKSNLASAIRDGLSSRLKKQLDAVKKSVQRKLREELASKKKELYEEVRRLKAKHGKTFDDKMKMAKSFQMAADKTSKDVNKKISSEKKKVADKVTGKLKDKLKDHKATDALKGKIPGFK